MSLYALSKLIYTLNRDVEAKALFKADPLALAQRFRLLDEERQAFVERDIGKLYVLGVNGQILMHYAALCEIPWQDYLELMREGVRRHGPVRAGIYAMTTNVDQKVAGV